MPHELLVSMKNIVKEYPGTVALNGANLDIHRGEIIGLLGENGAGKSTMMKILVGYESHDTGDILVDGKSVKFNNTREAMQYNIGMVYQDQALLTNLTVMENLFLGYKHLFTKRKLVNYKKMKETGQRILEMMRLNCSLKDEVSSLPLSTRELIEIGRLLWLSEESGRPPVIILDEPTTVLDSSEVEQLFEIVRSISDRAGIIFISHHLNEVLDLVDRVVVFRDGNDIASLPAEVLTVNQIQEMMIGRELNPEYYLVNEQKMDLGDYLLEIRNLTKKDSYKDISFELKQGEIISFVGLDGSGKAGLCRSLIGDIQPDSGEVRLNGKKISLKRPDIAIKEGIGFVPQDRRDEGAFLYMDIISNISIAFQKKISKWSFINRKKEISESTLWFEKLKVRAESPHKLVGQLSGGNQQKVILAKWLASNVKVLILDHPTRGIDVGAKEEIYRILRDLTKQGVSIILMCDSLEEDIGLSNRLFVMKSGRIDRIIEADPDNKPSVLEVIKAL
jgi:ribose transport system ATP-binding protein